MHRLRFILQTLVLALAGTNAWAQPLMTLEAAVDSALSRSLAIQVAGLNQQAADKGVYRSAAGFGPRFFWNLNVNTTANRVNQTFIDGRNLSRFGQSLAPNTNLQLDWTIYDGGRMQSILERLQAISEGASIETQRVMQDIAVRTIEGYYDILLENDRVDYLRTVIDYYNERLEITEQRWELGRGSKLDYLQARTDLNGQLAELRRAENRLSNAKVALNGIINMPLEQDFTVRIPEDLGRDHQLESLIEQAKSSNRDLLALANAARINLLAEKELGAAQKPQIGFASQLGYSYLNTNAGFLLNNHNASLSAGLRARWILYDGQDLKNQAAIARIHSDRLALAQDDFLQQLIADLTVAHSRYENDLELVAFEQENQSLAEENLAISAEKFKLGDSTILEVIEAQRTYDLAINRLVNAQHELRLSELDLLILSGSLVN